MSRWVRGPLKHLEAYRSASKKRLKIENEHEHEDDRRITGHAFLPTMGESRCWPKAVMNEEFAESQIPDQMEK